MTAIKQATGKVRILLDRNPPNALIPAEIEVKVIDTAPHEINAIDGMAKAALIAVGQRNFPAARIVLYSLMSGIRVAPPPPPVVADEDRRHIFTLLALALSSALQSVCPKRRSPRTSREPELHERFGFLRTFGRE